MHNHQIETYGTAAAEVVAPKGVPPQIRNPARWAKRRLERAARRRRGFHANLVKFNDLQTQLAGLRVAVDAVNAQALARHLKAGKDPVTFAAPLNMTDVADRCAKRIARYYGLHNKCHHKPGYRK